jgi:AcrR family transcriptional regulator
MSENNSKSERTKELIVTTALGLFAEHGFEKTTMRMIAKEAGLSLGAAYYHFRSKEELVLEFYRLTSDDSKTYNAKLLQTTSDFKKRLILILEYKFDQLSSHRELIKVLARHGADFSHPLSPFSLNSKEIRKNAIEIMEEAVQGSNVKVHSSMKKHLPVLLWMYQMGLILFWANDNSASQRKTKQLMELSLSMLDKLLKLSSLPLMGSVNRSLSRGIEVASSVVEQ